MTPQEFNVLPYNKRLDTVVKLYIILCSGEELIVNKKLNKAYFALRRHFIKESPSQMQCMYDFLYSLGDTKTPMTLTEFYGKVEAHKVNQRMQSNKPVEGIGQYKSLLSCLEEL